ncbi:hypothetical protein [Nonomuraea fuscirosea]|uniref:hypothetical protein n=1 Tax=Nonomuraea fuscirosea TaxID=1291556 RepID=UPI0033E4BA0F
MTDLAPLACARALALIVADGGPAETRRALEGAQALRGYAAALGVAPARLVTDLFDWLADNPAVRTARETYLEASAMIRLCRVLGVPSPEGLPQAQEEALIQLAAETGTPELRLRERLHHQATDRFHKLRDEFVASVDATTLKAVIERVQNSQILWAARESNLQAGR